MIWSSLAASNKELYLAILMVTFTKSNRGARCDRALCPRCAHAQRRRREWPSAAVPLANPVPPMRAQFEGTELGIEAHGVFF